MVPLLDRHGVRSAVDVGCGSGWYPLKLAERGVRSVGVEKRPGLVRRALYARKKADLVYAGFLVMLVEPESVALIPAADCVLLLAVWHHWVRDFGFDRATTMLASVWEKAGKLLFFETGEAEIPASWGFPEMVPDPRTWLSGWLAKTCPGGEVIHLGFHEVGPCPGGVRAEGGPPDGSRATRSLFAVVRTT
jgi:SAM-dependent methyltransferase